jgi:hypothetical protein
MPDDLDLLYDAIYIQRLQIAGTERGSTEASCGRF